MSSDSDDEIDYDKIYQTLFDKSWEKILADFDPTYFMDKVHGSAFLGTYVIREIQSITRHREKTKVIIEEFRNKGQEGFEVFVKYLDQTGQRTLFKYMKKLEDKNLNMIRAEQEMKEKIKQEQKKAEEPMKTFSDIKEASRFDGRIIELEPEWFETTIQSLDVLTEGRFGRVYKYSEKTDLILEIRRIPFEHYVEVGNEARNWVYWGQLMHFAINPLLAMGRDTQKSIYYLVYPFFENGTLREKLADDNSKLRSEGNINLAMDQKTRARIIYQIVSAICFLHTEVEHFRSAVTHGNVRSDQIYLDKCYNARLTNFGNAKECSADDADIQKDIHGLGIVILELYLSEPPMNDNDDGELDDEDLETLLRDNKSQIEKVWLSGSPREAVKKAAKQCSSGKQIKEIKKDFIQELLEKEDWDRIKRASDSLCDVCVINPKMKDDIIGHYSNCKLQLCVSCMRNSYLNPISCPKCDENIIPPIGQKWGALLIAGNDEEESDAKTFSDDIDRVEKKITMRYPLAMGIRKDLVYKIMPSNPGQDEVLWTKLQHAFTEIQSLIESEDPKIQSLLIYFTGHYDKEDERFCLGNDKEYIQKSCMEEQIKSMQNAGCKVMVLLDCCSGPRLEGAKGKPFIQLNSCKQEQWATAIESGSLFTSYFLKALGGKAMEEKCFNMQELKMQECKICDDFKSDNGFLTVDSLSKFIDKHQNYFLDTRGGEGKMKLMFNTDNVSWEDSAIAYYIDKPLHFEFSLQESTDSKIQLNWMPEKMSLLKDKLFEELTNFHKLPMTGSRNGDVVTITVKTGTRGKEKELMSMEQLAGAWNNKHDLLVKLRDVKQLHLGRAGLLLKEPILQILQEDFAKDLCQLKLDGKEKKVLIPVEGLSALYDKVEVFGKKKSSQSLYELSRDILKPVKNNKAIKKGMLVMSLPADTDGKIIPNFMIVAVEDTPKVLEPRSQGPTVLPSE